MRKVRGSADLVTHHPPTSSFPPTSFNTLCTLPAGPPCPLMPTAILFCSPRPVLLNERMNCARFSLAACG